VASALAIGVVLRTMQWFAGTSLWIDELMIARNVQDRGMAALLTRALDYTQVAPPGFLASVEASTMVFGLGERALRLVPWALSILGLFLFWRIARRFVSPLALVMGLLLFAASPALIWYGGNVKQYSGDVAWTLLLVLLALRLVERPDHMRRAWVAALVGGLALLSSHPAVLVGALIGLTLTLWWWRADPRPSPVPLAVVGACWSVAALVMTWTSLRSTSAETQTYMQEWWAEGYAPFADGVFAVAAWVPERLFHVLAHFLVQIEGLLWPFAVVTAALAVPGVVYLVRRYGWRAALVLAPTAAALAGGVLHLLPMRQRVAVYAGWPLLLAAMAGVELLRRQRSRTARWSGAVLAGLAALPLTLGVLTDAPPYRMQETRPLFATLEERTEPGDVVYVYCRTRHAAAFYGPRVGFDGYVQGECHETSEGFRHEVESLQGEPRVWFVYSQWTPEAPFPDTIRAHLEALGTLVDSVPDFYGLTGQAQAAAYLYDLSGAR
jgi:hypothetical protein